MTGRGVWWSFILWTPKHTWAWNFTPQKIPGIKISHPKNTLKSLKYLNYYTDLFNQTDSSNAWFCINKLMKLVCLLMSLHPPTDRNKNFARRCVNPNNTCIFLTPEKYCGRSLDPKTYRGCKFSNQKNTLDPPSCILRVTPLGFLVPKKKMLAMIFERALPTGGRVGLDF